MRKEDYLKESLEKAILAGVLPAVAGAVNATGFLTVGLFTSHVTGTVARTGVEWAQGHPTTGWTLALYIAVFVLGAAAATAMLEAADRLHRVRFVAPLLTEAAVLAAFAWFEPQGVGHPDGRIALACLLLFAMGLQNALVTRLSRAEVRTTHLTGIATDVGIELVRAALWLKDHFRDGPVEGLRGWWRLVGRDPEFRKLRLHLTIFFSFLAGAFLGPVAFLRWGAGTLMVPAGVVGALVLYDLFFGMPHQLTGLNVGRPRDDDAARPA